MTVGYGGVDNPVVDLSVPHRYKPGQILLRWGDAGRIAEAHLCTDGHVIVMTDSGIGNCKCGRAPPKRESPSSDGTHPFGDQPCGYRQSFKIIREEGGASHLCQFCLPDIRILRIWEPYGTACPKCGLTVFDDGRVLLAGRILDANDVRDLFLEAVSGASVEIKQEIKTPDADSFWSHSPQVGDVVNLRDLIPVPGRIGRYKFRKALEHDQVQIRCPVCGDETDHCPNGMRCRGKPAG